MANRMAQARNRGIALGIVQGINNYRTLQQAQAKLDKESEIQELTIKEKKLAIDKASKMDALDLEQKERELTNLKLADKAFKAIMAQKNNAVNTAMSQTKSQVQNMQTAAQAIGSTMQDDQDDGFGNAFGGMDDKNWKVNIDSKGNKSVSISNQDANDMYEFRTVGNEFIKYNNSTGEKEVLHKANAKEQMFDIGEYGKGVYNYETGETRVIVDPTGELVRGSAETPKEPVDDNDPLGILK